MLDLNKILLIAIGSTKIKQTHLAIKRCCKLAKFSKVFFFTNKENIIKNNGINYFEIPEIQTKLDYQSFIVNKSASHILPVFSNKESHILIINWDGFIVNPNAWRNYFFEFDYIGAPWIKKESPKLAGYCGNGGFCLKSKKFLETQSSISEFQQYKPSTDGYEDVVLSFKFRKVFENLGCKYAPVSVGNEFSTEHDNYNKYRSFGFHNLRVNKQFISKIL